MTGSARLCLATSRDLLSWTKYGPMFKDFQTRGVDKPWSKSGAILTTPIDGRCIMYFGDKDIYFAWSKDLIHWSRDGSTSPSCARSPGRTRRSCSSQGRHR